MTCCCRLVRSMGPPDVLVTDHCVAMRAVFPIADTHTVVISRHSGEVTHAASDVLNDAISIDGRPLRYGTGRCACDIPRL